MSLELESLTFFQNINLSKTPTPPSNWPPNWPPRRSMSSLVWWCRVTWSGSPSARRWCGGPAAPHGPSGAWRPWGSVRWSWQSFGRVRGEYTWSTPAQYGTPAHSSWVGFHPGQDKTLLTRPGAPAVAFESAWHSGRLTGAPVAAATLLMSPLHVKMKWMLLHIFMQGWHQ